MAQALLAQADPTLIRVVNLLPSSIKMKRLSFRFSLWIILSFFATLSPLLQAQERTFTAIDINSVGNPRGYWEFLPSEYHRNPNKTFATVFFLHGLGEGGNGTTDLHEVLQNGPPDILNSPSHPLYDLFENEGVIVLSPQNGNNVWWAGTRARPFIDFALSHYRIDTRRMYLTGLSSGSNGTHGIMNDDPKAWQFAAFVPCAVRGHVETGKGDYLSRRSAYWILTARDDSSSLGINSVNRLAGFFSNQSVTNVWDNYPDRQLPASSTIDRTASFDPANGWHWDNGVPPDTTRHLKMTIFNGGDHNSWDRTYNNANMWTWMLAQQKPTVEITSPAPGSIFTSGQPVSISATADDKHGTAITGTNVLWRSNLDGELGSGTSLSLNSLSIGVHEITCAVTDPLSHQYIEQTTTLSVLTTTPFTAQFDFGDSSLETPGWNNITDRINGTVENAIDINGSQTGVRVAITDSFDGLQTGGVIASDLFPETVQRDTMWVAKATPDAEILISGLNPSQTFDFTFFASRTASNNRTTNYSINGNTVSLNAANNRNQTVTITGASPGAAGEITLAVTCDAAATYGYLGAMVITTDGVPSSFASWKENHFTEAQQLNELVSGDLADPDGDGMKNLVEYAFNLNPWESSQQPVFTAATEDTSGNEVTISFDRDPSKTDLIYQLLRSQNLTQWTPIASSTNGSPTTDISNRTSAISESGTSPVQVTVTDSFLLNGQPAFYRIQIAR